MGPDMFGRLSAVAVGLVLIAAGVSKLAHPVRWSSDARSLGVDRRVSALVPPVEIVLGALLLVGFAGPWPPVAALGLLGVFTAVLMRFVGRDDAPSCACFGGVSRRPIGVGHILRNAVLMALALIAALTA